MWEGGLSDCVERWVTGEGVRMSFVKFVKLVRLSSQGR